LKPDIIETLGSSVIQHGPHNNRIYLMKLSRLDMPAIIKEMETLASKNKYTKIFCKTPSKFEQFFTPYNFKKEASIPGYFNGLTGLSFMSKFLSKDRENNPDGQEISSILSAARNKARKTDSPESPDKFIISQASEKDAPALAAIYREVFATYPFPIHDESYIRKTMGENISYFKVSFDGKIIAVSSAEKDIEARAVEMTDFAVLPSARGNNIAVMLLDEMEKEAAAEKYITFFTIARALSAGMNSTFAKKGYKYTGTAVNNTNISGKIESMNVWYKTAA